MKVFITEAAWADMLDIGRTIQRDSPTRAETFLDEFFERCDSLARLPYAYPLLPGRETSGIGADSTGTI